MSLLRFERVAFAYPSAAPLFAAVDLHLARGFTGVVGDNGAGKSTLFALLTGALAPTSGRVLRDPGDLVIAHTAQEVETLPADVAALGDRKWIARLGLSDDQLERWPTLSPGERRRWQFAAVLAREPDVWLLDEPTNHVDAGTRAVLLGALRRFRGIGVVISHDRELLDALTTQTVRVHRGEVRAYPGGYSAAKQTWDGDLARAREVRHAAQKQAERIETQLARARADQQGAEANRSASKRSKGAKDHDATTITRTTQVAWGEARAGRRVEVARSAAEAARAAIPELEHARELGRSVFVEYEQPPRKFVLELAAPVIEVGGMPLLRDVHVAVRATDRIHLAGDNGAGKSTLLATLLAASTLPRDKLLVVPQELAAKQGLALIAEAKQLQPVPRGRVFSLVAALGVDPDRLLATTRPSPGEVRKLALALGLGQQVWCVVLDEPTNHLDLPSIERLEAALAAYPGALVIASHDARFAASLTTATWRVTGGRVET